MSKTAEERIAELQSQIKEMKNENGRLSNYYSQAYKAMEEAKQSESYLKGQLESMQSSSPSHTQEDSSVDPYGSSLDNSSVESIISRMVSERIEPRIQMVEQYATDALQQTAGREVDRALKSFKEKHPESSRIMDFERLIMLDAADEVKRRQAVNQPVGDVKEIALKIATERVGKFNKLESKVAEENKKRREQAERKAMLPDMFASAGFEDLPKAPENAKEAGDLLEDLLRRQKGAN
jgi:FtsZ-binding cell division protein ZapB